MKTRMVSAAVVVCWGLFTICSCDEVKPTEADKPLPAPIHASAPPATVPAVMKPILLTKPVVLGPVVPSIVILPERMAEPEIRVRLTDEQDRPPVIAAGKYRGRIEMLKMPSGKFVAVNALPLDSYLQGVLTKEILEGWEPATFRAQAIAARTFALFQMVTSGRSKQWDVNTDESSQVYGGIAAETAKAKAAVAETRGQVLTAMVGGKTGTFCSFYSSCIGGAAQDPFDAWGDPSIGPLAAHLTGEVDVNSNRFDWGKEFVISKADVTRCVKSWGDRNSFAYLSVMGAGGGGVESVVISKRNPATQRPTELMLTDSAGRTAPMRAEEFRLAMLNDPQGKAAKPFSSNCDIRVQGDSIVLYNGHGYGHGIGMSQWGAQNLAKKGYTYTQILAYFYPGAGMEQLW